ncbi:CshA/CshB family fibrillar adhesin-related protein [Pseudomonas sp. CGJS7]|uniref:CshA/CshB family fibrillar adhesin-related protein n=1 Tax=Pseudomonas sp. CGJS7 TaxID=3109348 RepID=UPI00300B23A6
MSAIAALSASRRRCAGFAPLALMALAAAATLLPQSAQAQFATGGSGRFRPNILWFDWGTQPNNIPQSGTSVTNTFTVSGQELRVTCSLSNISGGASPSLRIYRPGGWSGDGLDDLYNIGGTGTSNTMDIGLRNRVDGTTVDFNFACSATIGAPGQPNPPAYQLDGLVVADAEQSSGSEYLQATIPTTNGGLSTNWRIIDRFRNTACTSGTPTTLTNNTGSSTLRFGAAPFCASGPMGVAFMENATSAQVQFRGGGGSAVALGVFIVESTERGDAPASYGDPVHLSQFTWSGGTLTPGTTTDINANSFTLASLVPPSTRLGTALDSEANPQYSVNADGDDLTGTPDDEDAFAAPLGTVVALPGQTYTSPAIACTGPGTVRGWIDFNRDGDFNDTGEQSSNSPTCTGTTTVSLNWTVPAGVQPGLSYMRVRIASNAAQIATPTGTANDGEVEDHVLTLANARVTVTKQVDARANAADQFTVSLLQGTTSLGSASTSGTATSATTGAIALNSGVAYTLRDALSAGTTPFARYQKSLACIANPGSGGAVPAPGAATGSGPVDWSLTLNPGNDLTCTIRNRASLSSLQINKDDGGQTSYTPGTTRNYVITVRNNGPDAVVAAQVTDPLPNGVTLTGPWSCSASAGSACSAGTGGDAGGSSVSLTVDLLSGGTATITVPVRYSENPGDY